MKVAVIGGGSTYTPELINGFMARLDSFPLTELWLMEALGETLSTSYIAVKESDIEGFAAEDEAFEYAAHRFRF